MTFYTTERGKSRTNIFESATGEFVCQLINREVAEWLRRAESNRAEEAVYKPIRRARRLEIAREYLAKRAARPVAPVQMSWL